MGPPKLTPHSDPKQSLPVSQLNTLSHASCIWTVLLLSAHLLRSPVGTLFSILCFLGDLLESLGPTQNFISSAYSCLSTPISKTSWMAGNRVMDHIWGYVVRCRDLSMVQEAVHRSGWRPSHCSLCEGYASCPRHEFEFSDSSKVHGRARGSSSQVCWRRTGTRAFCSRLMVAVRQISVGASVTDSVSPPNFTLALLQYHSWGLWSSIKWSSSPF